MYLKFSETTKMKHHFSTLLVLIAIIACMSFIVGSHKGKSKLNKREKRAVSEPMLIPTKEDTLIWYKIRHRYSKARISTYDFFMECIGITRGIADTLMLNDDNYDKLKMDKDLKMTLALSPLVIKGKILEKYPEDTVNCGEQISFHTNYIIEIEQIFKSDYKKLKIGDKVQAKVNLYGLYKSCLNDRILMSAGDVMEYQPNQSYFICLDKHRYMMILHAQKDAPNFYGKKEEYLPHAFIISLTSHDLSRDYVRKKITDEDILYYFEQKGK